MGFPPDATLNKFAVNNVSYPAIPFTVEFRTRDPVFTDVNFPVQKIWLNQITDNFWFLKNFYLLSNNYYAANWIPLSSSAVVETLTGDDGLVVLPVANNINILGNAVANGTHSKPVYFRHGVPTNGEIDLDVQVTVASSSSVLDKAGISSFNSSDFSVDTNGYVSILPQVLNYTNVTHAMSPYTVNVTTPPLDYYISVDCSGGTVTLNFPNAPTFKQTWIVKDRTGNASTNNISITTPGGTVTIDGSTGYLMKGNYDSINLLANSTPSYEVF